MIGMVSGCLQERHQVLGLIIGRQRFVQRTGQEQGGFAEFAHDIRLAVRAGDCWNKRRPVVSFGRHGLLYPHVAKVARHATKPPAGPYGPGRGEHRRRGCLTRALLLPERYARTVAVVNASVVEGNPRQLEVCSCSGHTGAR
jgi:hypothetical protein